MKILLSNFDIYLVYLLICTKMNKNQYLLT